MHLCHGGLPTIRRKVAKQRDICMVHLQALGGFDGILSTRPLRQILHSPKTRRVVSFFYTSKASPNFGLGAESPLRSPKAAPPVSIYSRQRFIFDGDNAHYRRHVGQMLLLTPETSWHSSPITHISISLPCRRISRVMTAARRRGLHRILSDIPKLLLHSKAWFDDRDSEQNEAIAPTIICSYEERLLELYRPYYSNNKEPPR
ncbi:uncharacterized protein MCYG_07535 [Microsporum canis CBS 113480]|uniref:Uncharacterized protein n=1 Tax=Arthroderma otae (strain ATCC MYA-4605 / CBS 113480) TaxID=554155 RepID=C5FYW8_ARTOC|nr:uncharacterized protein MCYG_07535 [Microsporum canis CBS 113480]EEQ34716.1 predicted protein [Microsporum canis CBS 113480]